MKRHALIAIFGLAMVSALSLTRLMPAQAATFSAGTAQELIDAINTANSNGTDDTITLTADITLTATDNYTRGYNGLPVILNSGSLTIEGAGYTLTRSGDDEFRFFAVDEGAELSIHQLTLTNGKDGAIDNAGTLTVSSSTLSGNSATYGGAIDNAGTLTVSSSTLSGNSASVGGAIDNSGTLTVSSSTFSGNSASISGAISNSGTLTVVGSRFSSNSATLSGAISNGVGSTLIVSSSTFSGNSATQDGGAIFNAGTVTVSSSTLSGNEAGAGGAIFNKDTLTVSNSILWGNSSEIDNDGGTATVNASIVQGGYVGTGNLDVDPLFVDPRPASEAPTTAGDYHLQADSPAIDAGDNSYLDEATLNVDYNGDGDTSDTIETDIDGEARLYDGMVDIGSDETVDVCDAYETAGYNPYLVGTVNPTLADDLIQAIACANVNGTDDTITLTADITLTAIDNTADGNNSLPVILNSGSLTIEGAGYTLTRSSDDKFRFFYVEEGADLTLNQLTVMNGAVADGAGGGAIYNWNGTVTVSNSTLSGNSAIVPSNSAIMAGAIFNSGTMTVSNSTLSGNEASTWGGAIYNYSGTLTVSSSNLSGNSASSGGAIVNSDMLTVIGSTLSDNSATELGGAILNFGTMTVSNSTLSGNEATQDGGVIYNDSAYATITVSNSTLSGNSAGTGGVIYTSRYGGTVTVTNSTLSGNSATQDGGVIANNGSGLVVTNSTLSGNSATQDGGAIANNGSGLVVTNSTLSGNEASNGGAIANNGSGLVVTNSTLSGNSASNGGAIANDGSGLVVTNSTLSGNEASNGGAIYNSSSSSPAVSNSILWGNSSEEIENAGAAVTVNASIVQGGYAGKGNLDVDPQFVAPRPSSEAPTTGGDYHLQETSPAINTGHNSYLDEATLGVDYNGDGDTSDTLETDVNGADRLQNSIVDMGPDEIEICGLYDSPYAVGTVNAVLANDLIVAIVCANANDTDDTITLTADITLTESHNTSTGFDGDFSYGENGLPPILNSGSLTIEGAGYTLTRSSDHDFRFFFVEKDADLTLNQLTLTGGNASGDIASSGGAILVNYDGTLTVNNSTLSGNTADNGGAIHTGYRGTLTVTNSTLSGNSATEDGGAIDNFRSRVTVSNSTLSGNSVTQDGGAIYNHYGTLTMSNSTLSGNSATSGGAIYNSYRGMLTMSNSTLSGNSANVGGAIFVDADTTMVVSNSTISGNSATSGGAIFNKDTLTVSNSILWGNSSEIANDGGTVTVNSSIVQGGYAGTGNLDVDPLFVNPRPASEAPTTAGDYHLQTTSPALDVGDNQYLSEAFVGVDYNGDGDTSDTIETDIDGQARVACVVVDMGADEVSQSATEDVNCDGYITPTDAMYVRNRIGTGDLSANVDGDQDVDADDFNAVTALIGTTP